MKICAIGDQHFRFQLPYASAFPDGRQEEWRNVKNEILRIASECDAVVLLGDNLNARHNHSSVNREFIEFVRAFGDKEVHIISGNHERFGNETALDFISRANIKNVYVYTEPTVAPVLGKKCFFLPYMTPGSLGESNIEGGLKKILNKVSVELEMYAMFLHHAVSGTTIDGETPTDSILNEILIPREEFEQFFQVIVGGHIHQYSRPSAKTMVVGSIFTQEIGEKSKVIATVDTDTNEIKEHLLPTRGIYKVDVNVPMNSYTQVFSSIPKNSLVKCYVYNQDVDTSQVRDELRQFDAYLLVEQYPSKRAKIQLDEVGGLDLTLSNLLSVYAQSRKVPIRDLEDALELIEHNGESIRS